MRRSRLSQKINHWSISETVFDIAFFHKHVYFAYLLNFLVTRLLFFDKKKDLAGQRYRSKSCRLPFELWVFSLQFSSIQFPWIFRNEIFLRIIKFPSIRSNKNLIRFVVSCWERTIFPKAIATQILATKTKEFTLIRVRFWRYRLVKFQYDVTLKCLIVGVEVWEWNA